MASYLMTWNSDSKTIWPSRVEDVRGVRQGETREIFWECGHSKLIRPDDRLILHKQGRTIRGLIGTAVAVRGWEVRNAGTARQPRRTRNHVLVRFRTLIDPDYEDVLAIEDLDATGVTGVPWNTRWSGPLLSEETADQLEALWLNWIGSGRYHSAALDDEVGALEGEPQKRLVQHRRREAWLRKAKIDAVLKATGKLVCEVPGCAFDFFQRYGEIGKGFAHVHHLDPLGSKKEPQRTTLDRLRIVCANCHAMIHRKGKCLDMGTLIPRVS